jgi:hypothetical protein
VINPSASVTKVPGNGMPNQGGVVLGDQRVEDAEVADDLTVGVRQQGKGEIPAHSAKASRASGAS